MTIHEENYVIQARAYRGKISSPREEALFTIRSEQMEKALEYAISHLSWRVSATNQGTEYCTLEQSVEAYRDEYRVERWFERLKGHPLSLASMYVQCDDHRVGLVRLLTIALRVLTLLEGVVRKNLQEQKRELAGLYAGNPKRRTDQPTAERLWEAFGEVTLTIVRTPGFIQRHITQLSSLQQDILTLLGFTPVIYFQLADDSWFPSGKWANRAELSSEKPKTQSERMQKQWEDPEFQQMQSEKMKKQWEDPEFQQVHGERMQKQWEDPEFQQMHSERMQKQWKNPEYCKKMITEFKARFKTPKMQEARERLQEKRNSGKQEHYQMHPIKIHLLRIFSCE